MPSKRSVNQIWDRTKRVKGQLAKCTKSANARRDFAGGSNRFVDKVSKIRLGETDAGQQECAHRHMLRGILTSERLASPR